MARTILEIYDEMVTEKETRAELNALQPNPDDSQTFLDDLTTTSKVGVWRLMFFVMAVAIWSHEVLFDQHQAEVEATADLLITGTARWLQAESLKYQSGDVLVYNATTKRFEYLVEDESLQIIARAAVVEVGGQARIKVAKFVDPDVVKLSVAELSAFTQYIQQIRFAGTNIATSSLDPDLLKVFYDITYDPLVLDATGTICCRPVAPEDSKPVHNAIEAFIANLPFDGVLNLTKLTDAIQAAEGVLDPVITSSFGKPASGAYLPIVKNYTAEAGHMIIDPLFPLDTTLTFIPG